MSSNDLHDIGLTTDLLRSEPRSSDLDTAGCRVETVTEELSDYPAFTNSITVHDFLGRVASVSSAVPSLAFGFSYLPGTTMVAGMTNTAGQVRAITFESERNVITAVSNVWQESPVAVFAYGNDALGRRFSRNADTFDYNGRSEVVGESSGSGIWAYAYDTIGNRVWSAENAVTNTYTVNCLNQYTAITKDAPCYPFYDPDGNMLTNGVWSYTWDAENRMTGAASNGVLVVSNAYDWGHCRVRKATASGTRLFAYDGWNLTAEVFVDAQTGATNVTRYLWGPDLSGTLQGAGGVGGLLAEMRSDGSIFFPCYDANGNITDYVDAYGTVRGHFEYDAFGNTVAMWGDLAHTFKFRFSTKYWDDETGLYYYGYRYYAPELGCWLNKDPIGERGGIGLYRFVWNDPANKWDPLGLKVKSNKNIFDRWIEKIYEIEEIKYDWGNAPNDLRGLGDASIGLTFSCSCVDKTSAGADLACTLTMRPVIRYPEKVESIRAHELRHVAVFENVYLASFRALFLEYTASGKCCNCDKRASEINNYGEELL